MDGVNLGVLIMRGYFFFFQAGGTAGRSRLARTIFMVIFRRACVAMVLYKRGPIAVVSLSFQALNTLANMKTSPFFLAIAASLMPTLTMGLVGISWGVSNVPASGLKDITFPFSIANAPRKTGYYFAQQFNFVGQNDVGYTGLQPRPDANGQPIIHAVFSSFIAGTTTSDSNCHVGADGGPGVSCAVEFSGPYANAYVLEIRNTAGTTWEGTAVDTVTGRRVHVGTYTLPAGTQGIRSSQVGFVEYYLWNDGQQHACSSLPYTSAAFGVPKTSTGGAVGSLTDAYEYGDCVGQVAFRNERTPFGVDVSVGF